MRFWFPWWRDRRLACPPRARGRDVRAPLILRACEEFETDVGRGRLVRTLFGLRAPLPRRHRLAIWGSFASLRINGKHYCSETTTPSPSKRILNPASFSFSIITFSSDWSSMTCGIRLPVQATRALDEIESGYSRVTRSVSGSIEVEIASEPLPKIFTVSIFRSYVES